MSGLSIPLIPSAYKLNINRESTNYRLNIDDRQCKNIDTHTLRANEKNGLYFDERHHSMEHFSVPFRTHVRLKQNNEHRDKQKGEN